MTETLVDELEAIDRESYRMATEVVATPRLRADLRPRADVLRRRLREIAAEMRKEPELYQAHSDQISEALLDLKFVIGESHKGVSLRLNRVIRAREVAR
jgi:hypothetical protein